MPNFRHTAKIFWPTQNFFKPTQPIQTTHRFDPSLPRSHKLMPPTYSTNPRNLVDSIVNSLKWINSVLFCLIISLYIFSINPLFLTLVSSIQLFLKPLSLQCIKKYYKGLHSIPLETLENLWFPDTFRGYRIDAFIF